MSEIKIHKSLKHRNIVKFEHVFEDKDNVYILLELCKNETLSELLKRRKRLTEFETRVYTKQIADALSYMHGHMIIHRDLKLSNMFLSDKMEVKLGDFGLAAKLLEKDDKRYTVCGTPNYIAPEILSQSGHSFKSDLWSLGVIIYTLIIGKPPFETNKIKSTYKLIKAGKYSFPDDIIISTEAKDLIMKILSLDQEIRLDLSGIRKHPFMKTETPLPDSLPLSTLSCPPSSNYMRQFCKKDDTDICEMEKVNENFEHLEKNNNIDAELNLLNRNFAEVKSSGNFVKSSYKTGERDKSKEDGQKYKDRYRTIIKYLDYSEKYGIGYLYDNKDVGVLFNDHTSLLYPKDSKYVFYIEHKKKKDSTDTDKKVVYKKYPRKYYPLKLKKKYTIFHYITNELLNVSTAFNLKERREDDGNISGYVENEDQLVFIRQFIKTKHAYMFKSSQKILLTIFENNVELRFDSNEEILSFIDTKGRKSFWPISSALNTDNRELKKHLKYVEELFKKILQQNKNEK